MRKSFVALVAITFSLAPAIGQQEHPHVAWANPDPKYPLQVHILSADRTHHLHAHGSIDDTESYGSGNVLGDAAVGFDYTSWCSGGFLHNAQHDESYEGRWKVPNQQLEILTVEVGYNKPDKCVLKVSVKPRPYSRDNPPPHLVTARN